MSAARARHISSALSCAVAAPYGAIAIARTSATCKGKPRAGSDLLVLLDVITAFPAVLFLRFRRLDLHRLQRLDGATRANAIQRNLVRAEVGVDCLPGAQLREHALVLYRELEGPAAVERPRLDEPRFRINGCNVAAWL